MVPSPYQHQLDAVEFFKKTSNGNLFFEMGTGKTRSAIMVHDMWINNFARDQMKTLIICPPVVINNWKDEFQKFSTVEKGILHTLTSGTGKKKAEHIEKYLVQKNALFDVVILNYETLLNEDVLYALEKWHPRCVIMDEVHYLKTPTSKRSKMVQRIADKAQFTLGLTGTPILKNVMDVYGIFRAVDGGKTFGTNPYIFQAKYLVDLNASWKGRTGYFPKWANNPKANDELNSLIYKSSMRKLKSECLDLPDLIKVTRLVEWEPKQRKAYDDLKKEFLAFVDTAKADGEKDSVTANLAMTKALRMLQVASGFVQLDSGEVHEFENIPRLAVTKDLLEELTPNHKVIVWACFKHNYKMLGRICDELKIKYTMITGEQSTNEKRDSEMAFRNDPDVRVIICNQASGGVGVNLIEASYSIIYSRSFNLAHFLQSEARNHRSGSQMHAKITKIDLAQKDSIDESVLEALNNKHQIASDILDMVR